MKNDIFARIIITTLLVTFLTLNVGRVTSVYALADPVISPELAPVFDTEIIQLQDYIENNVTPPQFEVFNILLGLYVASQGGFSEYKLHDPYGTQDGIISWLKSCGIQLYNSLIGMGAIGPDPITGIDYRPYIKGAMDIAMGCAVKSTQYEDADDFVSDVNVQEKYFIPMDFGIQGALNYIFSKNGGLYEWQFEQSEFTSSVEYQSIFITPANTYWSMFNSMNLPRVRANLNGSNTITNIIFASDFFATYTNILFNTTLNAFEFYSDDGDFPVNGSSNPSYLPTTMRFLYVNSGNPNILNLSNNVQVRGSFDSNFNSYPDIVQNFIDTKYLILNDNDTFLYITDWVKHFYYGSSWANKTEIFHNTDLNLDPNSLPYYQQITNDYLLDVKGILNALLNETDLTNVILNNIYDLDAIKVEDPKLIRVTTEILEEIQIINPPIPVNLNDFAIYTENDYLEEIRDRSIKFGESIGEYFVFWYNSDPVTVYVIFGSIVVILLGAFAGKLGHS